MRPVLLLYVQPAGEKPAANGAARSKRTSNGFYIQERRKIMEFMKGINKKEVLEISELLAGDYLGKRVKVNGAVHTVRDMGTVVFVILRKREGLLQCVCERKPQTDLHLREEGVAALELLPHGSGFDLNLLKEAATIEAEGILCAQEKAPGGIEIKLMGIRVLSKTAEAMPIPIEKWKMSASLETLLDLRPISMRNIRERAKFKLQEGIVRGFRDFLHEQGFTEVRTPKIAAKGAEGGSNLFRLDYFTKKAVLSQSPQFYKQMLVGVFDRVYEAAPVFRAEKHNTARHLNEYTSLDFEMGYIDGFEDIMAMETELLQSIMALLEREYEKELKLLAVELPRTDRIPTVRFDEAKRQVSEKYHRQIKNPYDLEPEEEVLIGRYYKEEYDADFVFVTHYPSKKRPFYAMDDPADETFTLSFDLLFRGMEITTGGQRIHDYHSLLGKIAARGMETDGMECYLSAFKHGMPPHGGLGIGLERLTMRLLGETNVRETTMFPRDLNRLEP